jgi:pyrroloquinoline quinone biosynthesis protein E
MVLNIVLHRKNVDQIKDILDMTVDLNADYVELASTQYYGWSRINIDQLLPTREQLKNAELVAREYQEKMKNKMKVIYVIPDYFEDRPKKCMNGWGNIFLTIAPDGSALPCHAAGQLPGLEFPKVTDHDLEWIWDESPDFNKFRGTSWMKEPCKSCDEKHKDLGGCRCQAYMLTGDATNADPVCGKSEFHEKLHNDVDRIGKLAGDEKFEAKPLVFRNMKNSKNFTDNKKNA